MSDIPEGGLEPRLSLNSIHRDPPASSETLVLTPNSILDWGGPKLSHGLELYQTLSLTGVAPNSVMD